MNEQVKALLKLTKAIPLLKKLLSESCKEPPDEAALAAYFDSCQEQGFSLVIAALVRDKRLKERQKQRQKRKELGDRVERIRRLLLPPTQIVPPSPLQPYTVPFTQPYYCPIWTNNSNGGSFQ